MARDLLQYTPDSVCRAHWDLGVSAAVVAERLKCSLLAAAVGKCHRQFGNNVPISGALTYFIHIVLLLIADKCNSINQQ